MMYIPDFNSNSCIVILNADTIRVFTETPTLDTSTSYTDYFVNSHYMFENGFVLLTDMPNCQSVSNFTTDIKIRNDFTDITLLATLIGFFTIGVPLVILSRFFKRFR